MATSVTPRKFCLKCRHCGTAGIPVRVDSQTPSTIVLALQCKACAIEWTAEGDLPVFLAWVKPDRRRSAAGGARLVH